MAASSSSSSSSRLMILYLVIFLSLLIIDPCKGIRQGKTVVEDGAYSMDSINKKPKSDQQSFVFNFFPKDFTLYIGC
ncbi:hypothetical protein Nepgr_029377 [Nepenthes gracilis]|uniref:Transmembrane protein n=1 Tax=Nepenthes gracilis TaxID=150966 RepID=A0AAD3TDY0_NEPGR|nr:hypothetical protein Nepgr_029377 [Nepenthes gracilis]